ncbi:MAG: response regulator [Candidatus Omnitrophota bacterium]|nr:response regulator [Candidatus Omnitrophota bacterium]
MRILLIEDNPDHTLFTKRVLKKANPSYEVDSTGEAKEALRKIAKESYDLILCDYRLPDSSALHILTEIRGKGRDLPFIVVTSSGSEKIAVELMQEGAYDYVVKDSAYENTLPVVIQRAQDKYNAKKEKEKLEEELRESNKKLQEMYEIKSNFTSMVSHELRTPLTAIKEGIAIVLDGSAGQINGQQKKFLEMAKKNVDRLKRLIDDVLDFSKLESKGLEFKMQEGNINAIINDVVEAHKVVAEEKGLYLKTALEPNMPFVELDPDRVNQVLTNLLSNAIKFTEAGGIIVSSAKEESQNSLEVCLRDTGGGIRNEDLPKLFQKFQQLGGLNQRKTGGTGLGLAISKEIIEQHNGKIWAESEYGKGSLFKFSLPIKRRCKILLIDDDQVILDVCERFFKENIYTAIRSVTGMEGVKLAQKELPDLIILDIRLNDISGYEVIDRLKGIEETRNIPILLMSGYIDELERVKGESGKPVLPWISKPFKKDEFLAKASSLLTKCSAGN